MDIERTMQFIVEHQAKLTAAGEKHEEQMAELRALSAKLADGAAKHDGQIAKDDQIATVTDLVRRVEEIAQ